MSCHYRFGSDVIRSSIPLPEIPRASADERSQPPIEVELGRVGDDAIAWRHHWYHDESICLSIGQLGETLWLRVPGIADFELNASAASIRCAPRAGVDPATIRHLLLDQVLPRFISHRGSCVLHASAVSLGAGLIAFVGATGSGKSTLAASFAALGNAAISDDCVLISEIRGQIFGVPSYFGLRMLRDSATAFEGDQFTVLSECEGHGMKRRFAPKVPPRSSAQTLNAVFLLASEPDQTMSVQRITGQDALVTIAKNCFVLDPTSQSKLAVRLASLATLVEKVPVFSLSYPRDYAALHDVHHSIKSALNQAD